MHKLIDSLITNRIQTPYIPGFPPEFIPHYDAGHTLLDESYGNRVPVGLALAGCDTGHDYEDKVQKQNDRKKQRSNANETQNPGDKKGYYNRNLEIQGLFTLLVDEGVIINSVRHLICSLAIIDTLKFFTNYLF
jgi:hypothetical protein